MRNLSDLFLYGKNKKMARIKKLHADSVLNTGVKNDQIDSKIKEEFC